MNYETTLKTEVSDTCVYKTINKAYNEVYCRKFHVSVWAGYDACGLTCPIEFYLNLQKSRKMKRKTK